MGLNGADISLMSILFTPTESETEWSPWGWKTYLGYPVDTRSFVLCTISDCLYYNYLNVLHVWCYIRCPTGNSLWTSAFPCSISVTYPALSDLHTKNTFPMTPYSSSGPEDKLRRVSKTALGRHVFPWVVGKTWQITFMPSNHTVIRVMPGRTMRDLKTTKLLPDKALQVTENRRFLEVPAPTAWSGLYITTRSYSSHISLGGTRLKFESWKVKNHTQNASQQHFYCFLKDIWILKSDCSLKSPIHPSAKRMNFSDATSKSWQQLASPWSGPILE